MKKLFVYMTFAMLAAVGVAEAQNKNITLEDLERIAELKIWTI